LEFFLRACLEQTEAAMQLILGETIEHLLSPSELLVWQHLVDVADAAPDEIAAATGVPRDTVTQALQKLP
jgi:hypothetical protein